MLLNLIVLYVRIFPKRCKFGKWTRLEKIAADIDKAVESNITQYPSLVISYISTALFVPAKILNTLPWVITVYIYHAVRAANIPQKIPLMLSKKGDKKVKEEKLGWDYDNRNWHYMSHLLAKEYGWGLEYIWGLDIDVALAHIQEIYTDQQLEHEFLWSMSEIAYPYNSSTKQSKFSPLQRPYFMQSEAPELKTIKIRKDMMPVGNIVDVSGMGKFFENKNTKIDVT